MKYAVDKIVDDIVTLENIETGDVINVNISQFETDIKETDIVKFENEKYVKDDDLKKSREESIREKMERLRNLS